MLKTYWERARDRVDFRVFMISFGAKVLAGIAVGALLEGWIKPGVRWPLLMAAVLLAGISLYRFFGQGGLNVFLRLLLSIGASVAGFVGLAVIAVCVVGAVDVVVSEVLSGKQTLVQSQIGWFLVVAVPFFPHLLIGALGILSLARFWGDKNPIPVDLAPLLLGLLAGFLAGTACGAMLWVRESLFGPVAWFLLLAAIVSDAAVKWKIFRGIGSQ